MQAGLAAFSRSLRSLFGRGSAATFYSAAAMRIPADILAGLRADDQFIVSYPRSGNTWLRHLLKEAIVRKQPTLTPPQKLGDLLPTVHKHPVDAPAAGTFGLKTRLLKSHNIRDLRGRRMVYIFRQASDALTSYHHLQITKARAKDRPVPTSSLEEFCRREVDGWCEHLEIALEQRRDAPDRTLFVAYEHMSANTEAVLAPIVKFLGLEIDGATLHEAVEACRFDRLKQREEEKREIVASKQSFRKGKVGGGAEELPAEVRDYVERKSAELYQRAVRESVGSP